MGMSPVSQRPAVLYHRIGGELIGDPSVERVNPADQSEVVTVTPAGDASVVDQAVVAGVAAQPSWAATPAPERGAILLRAGALLADRHELVATDLVREEGKTFAEAFGEVGRAIEILQYFGGEGRRGRGEVLPSSTPNTHVYTRREPIGVAGVITPWNFPIAIPTWKTAPALISGNAVVLKPATMTALSVWHVAEVLTEAGLPPGVLNIVFGDGQAVGSPLAGDPRVGAVSFTGSNSVGRRIQDQVTARHGRVQLEMGGKNPLVVLDDADPSVAARIAAESGFGVTGQACTAASRLICTPGIHAAVTKALIALVPTWSPGNGLDRSVKMGPVVSKSQLEIDLSWIAIAEQDGGSVRTPVSTDGQFLTPVVVTDVERGHRVAQEEVFGPVIAIMAAEDIDHAIELANAVRYGLSAGVVTNDLRSAQRFIDGIQAGIVKVNQRTTGVDPNVPFGGIKESSTNTYREQGSTATDFYTWTKSVYVGLDG